MSAEEKTKYRISQFAEMGAGSFTTCVAGLKWTI